MDWVMHTAKKKERMRAFKSVWVESLGLVDWHAHMNQTFYFQHVFFGSNDGRPLLDAVLKRSQMVDGAISFRVLQETQILFGLLVLQKVDSAMGEIKRSF